LAHSFYFIFKNTFSWNRTSVTGESVEQRFLKIVPKIREHKTKSSTEETTATTATTITSTITLTSMDLTKSISPSEFGLNDSGKDSTLPQKRRSDESQGTFSKRAKSTEGDSNEVG
jgi:hypothetical protein